MKRLFYTILFLLIASFAIAGINDRVSTFELVDLTVTVDEVNMLDGLAGDVLTTTSTSTLTNKSIDLTSNTLTATSAQLITAITNETGTGVAVFATSPTLVTPALGTPASGVLTNCTGLPSAGLTAGAKTHSVVINVADPGGADADHAAGYVLFRPSVNITITKVYLIPGLVYVAAASENDATITVTNAAVGDVAALNIVSALAAGSWNDMGAVSNASVVAGTDVTIAVLCNGTANAPSQNVQIEYTTVD